MELLCQLNAYGMALWEFQHLVIDLTPFFVNRNIILRFINVSYLDINCCVYKTRLIELMNTAQQLLIAWLNLHAEFDGAPNSDFGRDKAASR